MTATWTPTLRDGIEELDAVIGEMDDTTARDRIKALRTVLRAARGLRELYDEHELEGVSGDSAADQCASLYEVLNSVGLEVA